MQHLSTFCWIRVRRCLPLTLCSNSLNHFFLAHKLYTWWLQNVPGISLFLRNTKVYNNLNLNPLTWKIWWAPNNASRWKMGFNSAFKWLSHISFKTAHLCNYEICRKHSWKPFCESLFSSSVAFLVTSVAAQKRRPFHAEFHRGSR